MSKKAVQFGAGNIGRGFIGALLAKSGYAVTFADVNMEVIDKINADKTYTVHIYDATCGEEKIENISGMNSNASELIAEVATSQVVTTAVGLNILKRIAPTIVKAIQYKIEKDDKNYLNIIACENAIKASSQLKEAVYEELSDAEKTFADTYVGFPDCSVDRIVPPVKSENFIDVVVENYYEWNVEQSLFKGDIPAIEGMTLVDNLISYIERKLFTLNTGHAICAYLGYHKGLATIEDGIKDPAIYEIVKNAMIESGKGLSTKYSFDFDTHAKYIDKIITRFKNPYLKDDVARVGREPIRKLNAEDRLVKPLLTTLSYGNDGTNLMKGIAAALRYKNEADPESMKLQASIDELGVEKAFSEVSGITDAKILETVKKLYEELA